MALLLTAIVEIFVEVLDVDDSGARVRGFAAHPRGVSPAPAVEAVDVPGPGRRLPLLLCGGAPAHPALVERFDIEPYSDFSAK